MPRLLVFLLGGDQVRVELRAQLGVTATGLPAEVTLAVGAAARDNVIDGILDCENDLRFEQNWEREAGAQGASAPEQAAS